MNKTILLVGNPNVGKSVIFHRLTGKYAIVSNYPGTTVDISRGTAVLSGEKVQVIDTPGTVSLLPSSEDEQATRDVIFHENPDAIIQVADAKNLHRSLLLTLELIELGVPLVLVLNMHDEALERGIKIDTARLEALLGIPVIETVGVTGAGMRELKKTVLAARKGTVSIPYGPDISRVVDDLEEGLETPFRKSLALMLAAGDESAVRYAGGKTLGTGSEVRQPRLAIFRARNGLAGELVARVLSVTTGTGPSWLERLGDFSMRGIPGYVLVVAVLFLLYEFVGVFAAGTLVDLLEHRLFGNIVNPLLAGIVTKMIQSPVLRDFLIGPYGVFTMAVTYALAIVLPIVSAFFLFFGLLEDSGYLPRLSVMLDRIFRAFGLNGKAVLPMVLGLGCGTMAVLGSRILETRKERMLVILLLSLTIPCSAQLGVILGLLAGLSWKVSVLWIVSILGSLFLVGSLMQKLVPGEASPFVLEIPPLRRPSLKNILLKVKMRVVWYLKEAVPLFILGTTLLFIADRTGVLHSIEKAVSPLVVTLLGLPREVTSSFILGFLRRDYGAAGLFIMAKDGLLSPRQVLVSAVAITLFVPCIAQCFVVIREQGWKAALGIFVFVSAYAFLFSGLLNYVVGAFAVL